MIIHTGMPLQAHEGPSLLWEGSLLFDFLIFTAVLRFSKVAAERENRISCTYFWELNGSTADVCVYEVYYCCWQYRLELATLELCCFRCLERGGAPLG